MELSNVIRGFFLAKRRNLAKTTISNYNYAFRHLLNHFGAKAEFEEIDKWQMMEYQEYLVSLELSPRSVFTNWTIVYALWTFAEKELGMKHVMRGIERPTYQEPAIEPFSEQEIKQLLQAAEWDRYWKTRSGRTTRSRRPTAPRDRAIILVFLDSGIRVSELCDLLIGDYDEKAGRLYIQHGKGDKPRFVYLGTRSQKAVWMYLVSRGEVKKDDPLFCSNTNRPLHRSNIQHFLRVIGANANVSRVHPHKFRHTFAINFLRNGGNVFELQQILGHEKLETVRVYVRLAQIDIASAQRRASPADNWRL